MRRERYLREVAPCYREAYSSTLLLLQCRERNIAYHARQADNDDRLRSVIFLRFTTSYGSRTYVISTIIRQICCDLMPRSLPYLFAAHLPDAVAWGKRRQVHRCGFARRRWRRRRHSWLIARAATARPNFQPRCRCCLRIRRRQARAPTHFIRASRRKFAHARAWRP